MQLVRQFPDGEQIILDITEVEVYRGEDDLGCHASKGRTARTEVMYLAGGRVYVYLIYGMYWLLNITTGPENHPQAILIRGTRQVAGPGRVGKALHLDKTFYGENLTTSTRLWIEANDQQKGDVITLPRVGIDYAGPIWANAPWRFVMRV
jgi:DNA-3-methyladenine glycosylase